MMHPSKRVHFSFGEKSEKIGHQGKEVVDEEKPGTNKSNIYG